MARFTRIISGFPNWAPPVFLEVWGDKKCESKVWGDWRESLEHMKVVIFTRIDSRESPRFTLRSPGKQVWSFSIWRAQRIRRSSQGTEDFQQAGLYPYPLGAGLRDQIQKRALQTQKSFMHRVYSSQRGIETMVSDHVLEGVRPWGRGRSEFAKLRFDGTLSVAPKTLSLQFYRTL